MKILITGATGQLGSLLKNQLIIKGFNVYAPSRNELDLSKSNDCENLVKKLSPDWVINCGAYTNVENAEESQELVFKINSDAPESLAKGLLSTGGKLLHLSTDYVFDGSNEIPYLETQERNPLSIYGKSKAKGEQLIENLLFKKNQGVILRTSWLIGPVGNNFLLTMLKLHQNKKEIRVVDDQYSSPTSIFSLSNCCMKILTKHNEVKDFENGNPRILHFSDKGVTSWYELCEKIGLVAYKIGLIKKVAKVIPISSSDYNAKADRPRFSALNCSNTIKLLDISNSHWCYTLEQILEIKKNSY